MVQFSLPRLAVSEKRKRTIKDLNKYVIIFAGTDIIYISISLCQDVKMLLEYTSEMEFFQFLPTGKKYNLVCYFGFS